MQAMTHYDWNVLCSCIAEFCRYRCIADFGKPSGRADLWVHGLI